VVQGELKKSEQQRHEMDEELKQLKAQKFRIEEELETKSILVRMKSYSAIIHLLFFKAEQKIC
jgi:hypothetical protein